MNSAARLFCALALFGLCLTAPRPATAITADLANKCRQMALKAHPPKRVGTKVGAAGEERNYYRTCVANGGTMPEDAPASAPATPSR